jgi:hypothetical protein|tara:strand:- start:6688 stop:6963 length:276 start_codon:yes stop_codon:yes gene_type:complete
MKLVQIIWLDTNETSDSGWCSKDEAEEARPCRVASYGVVVKENDEFITIAADTDAALVEENGNVLDADDLFGRVQCFPKGCIESITPLKQI